MENTFTESPHDKRLNDLIAELSKNDTVEKTIDDILKYAIKYYDADRAYIFEVDDKSSTANNTYEICADGVIPEINNLQGVTYEIAPRWAESFSNGSPIILKDIEDIKEKYNSEYNFLKVQGITSLMASPYNKKGVCGCIGIDNPKVNLDDCDTLNNLAYLIMLSTMYNKINDELIPSYLEKSSLTKNDVFVKTFGDFELGTFAKIYNVGNVNSKQCISFFLYLLLNKNEIIPVEKLAKVFWPNQEVYEPYNYIKNLAFRTKKVLVNIAGDDLIIAKNGSYSINGSLDIITDYDMFDIYYEETKKNIPYVKKTDYYMKIIKLYKNSMFNNLSKEFWMTPFINKYESIYIDVVESYLKILYLEKRYDDMLKLTEKSIFINQDVYLFYYYTILAFLSSNKKSIAQSYLNECKHSFTQEESNELQKLIDSYAY